MLCKLVLFVILLFSYVCVGLTQQKTQCERIQIPTCQGLGYNVTFMPNMFRHLNQIEAKEAMQPFQLLLDLQCSQDLTFFLCSLFVPMCSELVTAPIPACRSHCIQVRNDCLPALTKLNMKWPRELECDWIPESPKLCMRRPTEEDYQMVPNLPDPETNFDVIPVMECIEPTLEDKELLTKWGTTWGWLCFLSTLFTLMTWMVDPQRCRYPERPVLFIALCYFMYSLLHILHIPDSCLVTSVLLYYTSLAGATWWTAFVLCWYLSASRDWSTEALTTQLSPRLHLICWGAPLLITFVFWGHLGGEACEFHQPFTVLIPHTLLVLVIVLLSLSTVRALFRVRRTLRSAGRCERKLERLMTRLGVYILLYLIPCIGWLVIVSLSSICDLWIEYVRILLPLLVGVLSGLWIWSRKTCKAWRKVICSSPPEKKGRSMPVTRV